MNGNIFTCIHFENSKKVEFHFTIIYMPCKFSRLSQKVVHSLNGLKRQDCGRSSSHQIQTKCVPLNKVASKNRARILKHFEMTVELKV